MYKRILVPLDGSELAEQVLPHVVTLAGCSGAQIVLLRIPATPRYDYLMLDPGITGELRNQTEEEVRRYIERIAEELRSMHMEVRTRIEWGSPVHTVILSVAHELGADLICMSTHGRSGFERMMIGSVAENVVRHSTVPVLLMRPKAVQWNVDTENVAHYAPATAR